MAGNHYFSNVEMTDMHLMYGLANCNSREARRLYQQKFPNRTLPCHVTFQKIHQRLRETGSLSPMKVGKSGRPLVVRNPEFEEAVLDEISNHPEKSTRELGLQFHVSKGTIWNILHEQQLYPFHVQRVQALLPRDYLPRVTLCQWFTVKCRDPNFLSSVLFTDEAKFSRTAVTNLHNTHIWAIENPHEISQCHHQYQFSVNVWAGILDDYLFFSFLPETLNGDRYLHFLTVDLHELLEDVPLDVRENMWFMLDGAPAHFDNRVRGLLNQTYANNWIGRGGPVPWPARSPDLNPLDFFLWGHLKSIVYSSPVESVEDLRVRISNGIERIRQTPGIFERVRESMSRRLEACIGNEGRHFEQLL